MSVPAELKNKWEAVAAQYEKRRAAMLPILRLAQEHYGYISSEVERAVAEFLETTPVHVREVVTFYELFRSAPQGKHEIRMCHTLSCTLTGCESLIEYVKQKLGIREGETTPDGKFTLHRAECLGACDLAPMMQIDGDFYGPLTKEEIDKVLNRVSSRA